MATEEPRATTEDISDELFEEAARWLTRLREPDVSPRMQRQFQLWLARDARRARAYDQACRLWGALDKPAKQAAADHEETAEPPAALPIARHSKRSTRKIACAVAAGACVVAWSWWYRGGLDDLRADYITAPGVHQQYVLEDGTMIDLNTDTAVAIDMKHGHRSVHIFRGEAYFTVAHDASEPFTVTTTNGRVVDVGTAFNVRIKGSRTIVSLVEGKVDVSAGADASSNADLRPYEEVVVDGARLGTPVAFDVSPTTAWRKGQMVFYQTSLRDVVTELNRYQRGRIVILGERLRRLPITGAFSTNDPTEAIHVIEATLGVSEFRLTDALTILH
jgi:transmembrane sensor